MKTALKEIRIVDCEGPNQPMPAPFPSFELAEAWIRQQAEQLAEHAAAGGRAGHAGCLKADVVVEWIDGVTFEGTYLIFEEDRTKTGQLSLFVRSNMPAPVEDGAPIQAVAMVNGEQWSVALIPLDSVTVAVDGRTVEVALLGWHVLQSEDGEREIPRALTLALRAEITRLDNLPSYQFVDASQGVTAGATS